MLLLCCVVSPDAVSANERAYAVFQEGVALESTLNVYEARDKFRASIEIDASNVGFHEHYAWFLHFNGFSEEAVAVFGNALSLKPSGPELLKGKAWNLKAVGRLPESLKIYKNVLAMKSSPDDTASATAELKLLLAAENDKKIIALKGRLAQSPDDQEASRELFRTLAYQGRFPESLAVGERLLATIPHDMPLRHEYAKVLSWSGQRGKSVEMYQQLLSRSPDNPFLMFELATVLADGERLDESLKLLERARGIRPESPRIARAEAEVLARLGKEVESISRADAVKDVEHEGLERALARARSRHFSGLLEEAVQEYSAALALYPHHPELLQGLSECALYTGANGVAAAALTAWKAASPGDSRQEAFEHSIRKTESSHLKGEFQYYGNSSDFKRINTGISGASRVGRDLSLFADAYLSRFIQSDYRDVHCESLAAGMRYRLLPRLEVSGRIGGNIYGHAADSVTAMVGVITRFNPGWHLALAWERMDIIDTEPVFGNAIYNHVVTMGAVGSRIKSDEYSIYVQKDLLSGRLALSGKATIGDYSDGNLKQTRNAGVSYRLYNEPRITAGYQYFFLDYRDPAPAYNEGIYSTSAYYDPLNLEVHTLFLDISHQLSKTVRGGIEPRISYVPKSDGTAYALFGSLESDLGRSSSAKLSGRFFYQDKGVDRHATSGYFTAQEIIVAITVYF